MNNVAIIGRVTSTPRHHYSGFMHTTEFDLSTRTGRRDNVLHVVAHNDLAQTARHLAIGDQVAVTGYLRSEAFDMPDRSIWYQVESVAYELDRRDVDRVNLEADTTKARR